MRVVVANHPDYDHHYNVRGNLSDRLPEFDQGLTALMDDIRATGARIRLISDGDLSAGITAAVLGAGVHAVMGIGGAPEGVITAAAMRCLNGEILARLVVDTPELEERVRRMGIKDKKKIYTSKDLAPGAGPREA